MKAAIQELLSGEMVGTVWRAPAMAAAAIAHLHPSQPGTLAAALADREGIVNSIGGAAGAA